MIVIRKMFRLAGLEGTLTVEFVRATLRIPMLFLRKSRHRRLSLQHYGPIREVVEASTHAVIFPNPKASQPADGKAP